MKKREESIDDDDGKKKKQNKQSPDKEILKITSLPSQQHYGFYRPWLNDGI